MHEVKTPLIRLAKRDAMPRGQVWAIRVGSFVLAILIVYHTLTNLEYTTLTVIIVIVFAIYACFQALIMIAAALYKRSHPDLNLDFITEDPKSRKKSRH